MFQSETCLYLQHINMKKIQNAFWLLLGAGVICYIVYKIAMNSFTAHFLGSNPKIIKAVIINEKNYLPNQPVKSEFSYSYSFIVNGKQYKGNSHGITFKIGDSVWIEYNQDHPDINRVTELKD